METTKCFKCGGKGKIPAFTWNRAGVCFVCSGTGKTQVAAQIDWIASATREQIILDLAARLRGVINTAPGADLADAKLHSEWTAEARYVATHPACPADVSTRALTALARWAA